MPVTQFTTTTPLQIKIGAGRLDNIVAAAPGTTWIVAIKDGPDPSGNFKTIIAGATISAGQLLLPDGPYYFTQGLQASTTSGTAGELDFFWQ
jgi:hypothetical protein